MCVNEKWCVYIYIYTYILVYAPDHFWKESQETGSNAYFWMEDDSGKRLTSLYHLLYLLNFVP